MLIKRSPAVFPLEVLLRNIPTGMNRNGGNLLFSNEPRQNNEVLRKLYHANYLHDRLYGFYAQ